MSKSSPSPSAHPVTMKVKVEGRPIDDIHHLMGMIIVHYGEQLVRGRFRVTVPKALLGTLQGIIVDLQGEEYVIEAQTVVPLSKGTGKVYTVEP